LSLSKFSIFSRGQDYGNYETTKLRNYETRGAFTLVEIIFVIAIIGILAAFLLPGFSKIKSQANRMQDMAKMKKYAEAWKTYTVTNNWGKIPVDDGFYTVISWDDAGPWTTKVLAGVKMDLSGGNHDRDSLYFAERSLINDSGVYCFSGDPYAAKCLKDFIIDPSDLSRNYNQTFASAQKTISGVSYGGFAQFSFSFCVILGLEGNVPDNTPIAFTRGLKSNGLWDDEIGVYGSSGGYIAFANGSVKWFDGKRAIRLLKWDQSGHTSDIREALPNSAYIRNGTIKNAWIQRDDGGMVLLRDQGSGGEY